MSEDGQVRDLRRIPIEGDWTRHVFRQSSKRFDDFQHGPEEITHRLKSDPARRDWIQIVQEDERPLFDEQSNPVRPTSHVVRFYMDHDAVDTLAVLEGALTLPERDIPEGFVREYSQPTFSPRPVAAAGDRWVAIGTGDSASIHIDFDDGRYPLKIRWPRADEELGEEDKRNHYDWLLRNALATDAEFARQWKAASRTRREYETSTLMTREDWSQKVPEITAMWGGGKCLLLAGFASADTPFGESSRMILLNVYDPAERQAVRIPRGSRVRDISNRDLYTVSKSEMGEWRVELFGLPFSCEVA